MYNNKRCNLHNVITFDTGKNKEMVHSIQLLSYITWTKHVHVLGGFKKTFSSQTKGPGEQGAAGYCPKILLLKRAKVVSVPSIRVMGKSALEISQFLRRNFWKMSGGAFLSRPLCVLLLITVERPGNDSGANFR